MRHLFILITTGLFVSNVNGQTQSIIYDATAIMNARHGVNALLIPKVGAFDIVNPLTGKLEAQNTNTTPDSLADAGRSEATILEILRRNAGLPQTATRQMILDAYRDNPFLRNILGDTLASRFTANSMRTVPSLPSSGPPSGLGGDILGNLVNGTADFLIKRAQEELSVSVFSKLQQLLQHYPEFNTLFPSTCALIKPVNAYEYDKALIAFKGAIKEDLKEFVSRVPDLYSIPRYQLLNEKAPVLTLVFSSTTVLSDMHNDKNFATCLKDLGEKTFLDQKNNYAGFLKITALVSNSLLAKALNEAETKAPAYIQKEYISAVTHQDNTLLVQLSRIYLGLLWQHARDINFVYNGGAHPFSQLLDHWSGGSHIENALVTLQETLGRIQDIGKQLQDIRDDEHSSEQITGRHDVKLKRFALYAKLVEGSLGLSALFEDVTNAPAYARFHEMSLLWPSFATSAGDMVKAFGEGEYSLGLSGLERVLKTLSDYLEEVQKDKTRSADLSSSVKSSLQAQKTVLLDQKHLLDSLLRRLPAPGADPEININTAAQEQELKKSIAAIDEQLDAIKWGEEHRKRLIYSLSTVIKCTNLLAAISKAENSAAVEALLDAYALPAGSSRIKKVSTFNISINAYVGGFYRNKGVEGKGFTNNYGLTAPIGFAFSTGFQRAGSLSAFLGAFDIGSTVRYKLDNNGEYQQHISLAGIVSPSVQLVYGFPFYLPISAGLGCQWISPVSTSSSKIELKPRFNAFVGVDIPLFNLTRSRGLK